MPSFWSILEFQHMNLGAQTLNSWYINNLSSYLKREKLASGIKKNKDESEKAMKIKSHLFEKTSKVDNLLTAIRKNKEKTFLLILKLRVSLDIK